MIMCLHKTKFEFLNRKKAGWLVMQTCHPNYLYLLAISLPHPCLMTYLTWLLTHIKWNDQALLWYTGNLNIYIRMCTMVCYIQHIWTEIMLMKEGWGWRRQKKKSKQNSFQRWSFMLHYIIQSCNHTLCRGQRFKCRSVSGCMKTKGGRLPKGCKHALIPQPQYHCH